MIPDDGWTSDAFFDAPPILSVDGGTTSSGHLWHGVSPRWGHSMHTMCSYHGMFPAKVAHYFIQRYSRVGDVVLDPFSGRGTTVLQARMEGRISIGNDLSPLAYALSRAKVDPPSWEVANRTIDEIERSFHSTKTSEQDVSPDISMLYHPNTLRQLSFVRKLLLATPMTRWNSETAMIAGALAGIMHGSWRRDGTSQYLSISMPNTFSMSPAYVSKYIAENGLRKLDQDVFECLRDKIARLYLDETMGKSGSVHHADAAELLNGKGVPESSVDLIVTSPPYLQVVNYATSNWIRLWLLGLDDVGRERGVGRKRLNDRLDHRHSFRSYCEFIARTLAGVRRVLKPDGVAVMIIGDVKSPEEVTPMPLAAKVWDEVGTGSGLNLVELIEDDLPVNGKVSRIWGETRGQATARDCALVLSRGSGRDSIKSFSVEWDEPYKDGGPDAAHDRLERLRRAAFGAGWGKED